MSTRIPLVRAIAYYEWLATEVDSGRRHPELTPRPTDMLPVIAIEARRVRVKYPLLVKESAS